AEDGIRDATVTGVQTCALPILDEPEQAFLEAPEHKTVIGEVKLPPAVEAAVARAKAAAAAAAEGNTPSPQAWGTNENVTRELHEIGRASCRERGAVVVGGGQCK